MLFPETRHVEIMNSVVEILINSCSLGVRNGRFRLILEKYSSFQKPSWKAVKK